jgi:HlyD family secretion protein
MANRKTLSLRALLAILLLCAFGLAGWMAFRPRTIDVDMAKLDRGTVDVMVVGEGVASVHDSYDVSAPVAGRLQRIPVEVGDPVVAGRTVLAKVMPADSGFLDTRTLQAARAHAAETASQAAAARAMAVRAEAEARAARLEHDRVSRLVSKGWMAPAALDNARSARDQAAAGLAAAQAQVSATRQAVVEAQAALAGPTGAQGSAIALTSPVSGQVLEIRRKSETVIPAGETILVVGNPSVDLEIVADLLSTDAVRVRIGTPVTISEWGGPGTLSGEVRLVEPNGFTKVSALGVEEQRVNVRISLKGDPAGWSRLGHGYRVTVGILVDKAENVLRVPVGALFRTGDSWTVFVNEYGRAQLRPVRLGLMNADHAEVRDGLLPGEQVVLFPAETIRPGMRLRSRGMGR